MSHIESFSYMPKFLSNFCSPSEFYENLKISLLAVYNFKYKELRTIGIQTFLGNLDTNGFEIDQFRMFISIC